jgi:N-acetylneuraminic acid mutarotase
MEMQLKGGINASKQHQWKFIPSIQNHTLNWKLENPLIEKVYLTASFITKNYIYILGGSNGDALNTIQRASFDNNGNLTSTWSKVGTLPIAMAGMGYVATKNRLYLISGHNDSDVLLSVFSTPINEDGSLGEFREETPLPDGRFASTCFVIKDKLYVISGYNNDGVPTNTIYQTTINNDGRLSNWIILPNSSIECSYGKPLFIKDRIYILGLHGIYYTTCDSNGDIGTWTYVGNIPNSVYGSAIVCIGNYVFSIGGYGLENRQYTNAVYCAAILDNGDLDKWVKISNIPVTARHGQAVVTGNKIYFIGGYDGENFLDTVYSASLTLYN